MSWSRQRARDEMKTRGWEREGYVHNACVRVRRGGVVALDAQDEDTWSREAEVPVAVARGKTEETWRIRLGG